MSVVMRLTSLPTGVRSKNDIGKPFDLAEQRHPQIGKAELRDHHHQIKLRIERAELADHERQVQTAHHE